MATGTHGPEVRSIRAVERAMRVLDVLSQVERVTPAQLVKATNLPRTTVYRVVRTLVALGYASEWPEHGTFGPGPALLRLAGRSDPLIPLVDAARPFARELSQRLRWPVTIATVSGGETVVRYSTDGEAPLAANPQSPGVRLPLLQSASGRLHLAYAEPAERELWLDLSPATQPRADLEAELAAIRRRGWASFVREGRLSMRCSLAAPVFGPAGLGAALVLRYAQSAVRSDAERQQFVDALLAAAAGATAAAGGRADG